MRKEKVLARVCYGGIVILVFLLNFHTLADTDIFWHLRTGEVIFRTRSVPSTDIYSFTMNGQLWIDAQWLFQLVIFFFYKLAGYAGMIIFGAVLSALTWFLILKPAFNPQKYFLVVLLCLVSLLAASMRMNLRPETMSYFFLAAELFAIHEYRRGKSFYVFALPLILLLWVNTQGIWPIYFVALSVYLFEEILFLPGLKIGRWLSRPASYGERSSAIGLGISLLVSAPMTLSNPNGFRGVMFPLKLFYDISSGALIKSLIIELQSPFSEKFPLLARAPFIILLAFSGAVILWSLARRRIYLSACLLWAIFLGLALTVIRNVPLFAMVSASLIGMILAEGSGKEISRLRAWKDKFSRLRPYGAAVVLAAMVFLAGDVATSRFFIQNRWYSRFGTGVLETDYPIRAGRHLQTVLAGRDNFRVLKIFADFPSANYLMWIGYPDWLLYFDTRLDQLYPEQLLRTYIQSFKSPQVFNNEDLKYGFDVVVLSSFFKDKDFILRLSRSPDWALIYLDGFNVVFLKNKPEFADAVAKYRLDLKNGLTSPLPKGLGGLWLSRERLYRGYMVLALGHPEVAVREFLAGLTLDPEDPNLNFYLGAAYNQMSLPGEARVYLEKAAKSYPDSAKIRVQLARSFAMLGETGRAIKILQQVLEKDPKEISACMDLARVYELAKSNLAAGQWRTCLQIYESDPAAFAAQGGEILDSVKRLGKGGG